MGVFQDRLPKNSYKYVEIGHSTMLTQNFTGVTSSRKSEGERQTGSTSLIFALLQGAKQLPIITLLAIQPPRIHNAYRVDPYNPSFQFISHFIVHLMFHDIGSVHDSVVSTIGPRLCAPFGGLAPACLGAIQTKCPII